MLTRQSQGIRVTHDDLTLYIFSLQYLFNSVIYGSDQEHTASYNRVQWLLYKISSHENMREIFNLFTNHCKPAANQRLTSLMESKPVFMVSLMLSGL